MLMTTLLTDEGYQVLAAADGPAGLHLLREAGTVDLLITDLGLPGGLNGRQVAAAARALQPDLPVLFITGYDERVALDSQPFAHDAQLLAKPFAFGTLIDKIHAMLRGAAAAVEPVTVG